MTDQRLAGRVAIVTGSSRGLGKTIATTFAAEGAAVAVVARTEAQWDERLPGTVHDTVAEIEAAGGRAVAIAADLANPADVDRLVEETRQHLGPIDLLVNNAALTVPGRPPSKDGPPPSAILAPKPKGHAGFGPGTFLGFPLKGYRMHFEIGLFATFRLMQLVLPDMLELGRGSIVNISSVAAFMPGPGPYPPREPGGLTPLAYGGNKAAMQHLTQAVAWEMAPYGIAVNALMPSIPVISPGNLQASPDTTDWGSQEDFAEATLQVALANPDAMTGQILYHEDVLHPELGVRGWLR
jgi:NAD(P)-dependent dehydrogenase (short-subunit alcohol dehydrogenase family)